MQRRFFLALVLVAGVFLMSLAAFHTPVAHAADRRLPAACARAPQIMPDALTHQDIMTGQDTRYRSWMVKLWCPARDARQEPAGLTRYVVALTANRQCQQVTTGVPYPITYGWGEHLTAITGITVLDAADQRLSTTPPATFRLCPGQFHVLTTPWLTASAVHVGIFSLALPQGGFILLEY